MSEEAVPQRYRPPLHSMLLEDIEQDTIELYLSEEYDIEWLVITTANGASIIVSREHVEQAIKKLKEIKR